MPCFPPLIITLLKTFLTNDLLSICITLGLGPAKANFTSPGSGTVMIYTHMFKTVVLPDSP